MPSTTDPETEPPDQPDPGHVLTWRQGKIVQFIRDFGQAHGYAPTLREIGKAVGLSSTSSVSYQLSVLQGKGYLRRDTRRPRTVEVRVPGQPAVRIEAENLANALDLSFEDIGYVSVPLIGQISAGPFRLADQVIDETFMLSKQLVGAGQLFMLTVVGDSMIGAAIMDGDWVVVRQQQEAQTGEIVVAMIEGEATIKTFKRTGDHVWLMPHNAIYTPLLGDNATIIGKVVSVLRRVQREITDVDIPGDQP